MINWVQYQGQALSMVQGPLIKVLAQSIPGTFPVSSKDFRLMGLGLDNIIFYKIWLLKPSIQVSIMYATFY